jgi:hypothetical protein
MARWWSPATNGQFSCMQGMFMILKTHGRACSEAHFSFRWVMLLIFADVLLTLVGIQTYIHVTELCRQGEQGYTIRERANSRYDHSNPGFYCLHRHSSLSYLLVNLLFRNLKLPFLDSICP